MHLKKQTERIEKTFGLVEPGGIKALVDTALGREKADMVVAGADLVNVYSGELLKGWSVAVKGDRIAYVGEDAGHTVGPDTTVIDAAGKVLVPGFIDPHAHIITPCHIDEFLGHVMKGGTTAIVSETVEFALALGYRGVRQFLEATEGQPVKVFATVPPLATLGPAAQMNTLRPEELRRLLKHKRVLGLGEVPWQFVLKYDDRFLRLYAEALDSGKKIEGHGAGAREGNLAAYVAAGISACHESTTAEEALQRLRQGLHVIIRESAIRKELEAIAGIKDENIDFRRLSLCIDGVFPKHVIEQGYLEAVVQKAIDLGFDPVVAIQMATINAAERFSLDNIIGGIAPGKYADMVIIPHLRNIKAEMVISNGQVVARNGRALVQTRKHSYPKSVRRSLNIPGKLQPADFRILIEGGEEPVIVRVVNLLNEVVTREEQLPVTPVNGLLEADVERDILKVAFIERTGSPGKMFTGFVKGFKLKKGAFATSISWGSSGITVVGTNNEDMAGAVNRIKAMQGGVVVYNEGKVLAELPLPIAGYISDLPAETVYRKSEEIQQKLTEMGTTLPDAHLTLIALTHISIPFLSICGAGLMDIGKGKLSDLVI